MDHRTWTLRRRRRWSTKSSSNQEVRWLRRTNARAARGSTYRRTANSSLCPLFKVGTVATTTRRTTPHPGNNIFFCFKANKAWLQRSTISIRHFLILITRNTPPLLFFYKTRRGSLSKLSPPDAIFSKSRSQFEGLQMVFRVAFLFFVAFSVFISWFSATETSLV